MDKDTKELLRRMIDVLSKRIEEQEARIAASEVIVHALLQRSSDREGLLDYLSKVVEETPPPTGDADQARLLMAVQSRLTKVLAIYREGD